MATYWMALDSNGTFNVYALSGSTLNFQSPNNFAAGVLSIQGTPATLAIGDTVNVFSDAAPQATAIYRGLVTDGGIDYPVLDLSGNYIVLDIPSTANQTLVAGVICFLAGTRIATADGAVAVEQLQLGDLVRVASGGLRPVVWIGRQSIDPQTRADPSEVLPIRLAADAVAPGQPASDLFLSPEHAVLIDGWLVAARQLVNGGSIRQEPAAGVLEYYHIELDSHDVVLAEGLACETYLELANRDDFHSQIGAGQVAAVDRQDRAASCVPFLNDAAELERIWRRLAARSTAIGLPTTEPAISHDPALRLVVDGHDVMPFRVEGGRHRFMLPAGAAKVELVSRAATPPSVRPWLRDHRRLGVALRRLTVQQSGKVVEIAPDDAAFAGLPGWWGAEPGLRWTGGAAQLPCDASLPAVVEVDVLPAGYPVAA